MTPKDKRAAKAKRRLDEKELENRVARLEELTQQIDNDLAIQESRTEELEDRVKDLEYPKEPKDDDPSKAA